MYARAIASLPNTCKSFVCMRNAYTRVRAQRDLEKIHERRKKRKYFHEQIPKHLKELDKWLKQDFQVGSKVHVKYRGDTMKPSWPAELIAINQDSFKVKWNNVMKVPPGERVGSITQQRN